MEKIDFEVDDFTNIIKLTDKKSDNYVHIDLNRIYRTMTNDKRNML